MATITVSLPDAMKAWVERQADGNRYGNVSNYIRDLIRKDQERMEAIAALQTAITRGVESGPPEPFDVAALKHRMHRQHEV
ncbi:addiction module antitoxin [Inquilinus limosus MP06]|uniref:Addiction module antitoxin n=2 Tax=Inquilinus limosus TaxID=171674 RepID=A0A0A0D7C7_9PROT|nr:addiction module antitoxin [Inquilinus limosus MP06]